MKRQCFLTRLGEVQLNFLFLVIDNTTEILSLTLRQNVILYTKLKLSRRESHHPQIVLQIYRVIINKAIKIN